MDKKRFDDTKIEEYKFHQNKISISINSIDINKIVVSNMFPFSIKNSLSILLGIKMLKKLDIYAYSLQKCLYTEEILMKLNVCILTKEENVFDKYINL